MLRLLLPLVLGLVALTHAHTSGIRVTPEPPLSPAEINNLEAGVQANPNDFAARLRLLRHYNRFPQSSPSRLNHILYLVENLPSDPNASTPLTYVPLADAGDHAQVRQAWLGALQRFPDENRVLKNAVRFLYREHPQEAEQLLRQTLDRDPANRTLAANLGFLYALHILGISSPVNTASTREPDLHLQLRHFASQELDRTTDPYVLAGAGTALPNLYPRTRAAALGQRSQEPFEFAAKLRQRARELATAADTNLHEPMPLIDEFQEFQRADISPGPPPAPPRAVESPEPFLTVNRLEQEAKLIERPEPVYPELAQKARIQGAVLFQLLIDKEGRVENAMLLAGHPLLVPAATAAIRGYRYQPTVRDGQAVKVRVDVGVPFVLR